MFFKTLFSDSNFEKFSLHVFFVKFINILGDNVKWTNKIQECQPGSCDPWGHHPCNRRVQDREGLPYLSCLHSWKCSPTTRVCFLVSEWQDDQLWLKSWRHCHNYPGQEDKFKTEHPKVSKQAQSTTNIKFWVLCVS